jgi:KaiC/GvpD/RAD55 family RecA-like ATPase
MGVISTEERIPLNVHNLDPAMEGGVPPGFISLICGHAGTMKSSVAFNILANAARKQGRRCLHITLEQHRDHLIRHASKLGMFHGEADVDRVMELVSVVDLATMRREMTEGGKSEEMDWPAAIVRAIKNYKEAFGCDVIVLDSLAALYALSNFENPRAQLFHFFEKVREVGATAFFISEMPTDRNVFGLHGVEDFLSDGIVHLKVDYSMGGADLYIGIVKMRETKHPRSYHPLIWVKEQHRFEIVTG